LVNTTLELHIVSCGGRFAAKLNQFQVTPSQTEHFKMRITSFLV